MPTRVIRSSKDSIAESFASEFLSCGDVMLFDMVIFQIEGEILPGAHLS